MGSGQGAGADVAGGDGYSPELTSVCWGVLTAVGHRVAAGWVVVVERNNHPSNVSP